MDTTATIKSSNISESHESSAEHIDSTAFAYVGIILFTYRIFTSFMQIFPQTAASGAAINCLVSSIVMLIIVTITMSLCKRIGSLNLLEICGEHLGSIVRIILGILAVIFLTISAANAVIEFSAVTKNIAFKTAPVWFLALFFALIIFFAQRNKLSTVLGVFSVLSPIIIILLVLLLITSFKYGDMKNLFPVLGNGAGSIFTKGLKTASIYSDFILLLFTSTKLDDRGIKKVTRAVKISAFSAAALNIFAVLMLTLCTSYPFSKDIANPLYHLVEIVYYGRFFQRIDGFYMLVAIFMGMLYVAYSANILLGISQNILRIKNTKPISVIYPIIIMILACALSDESVNEKITSCITDYSYIFGLILPFILIILIYILYNSKRKKNTQNKAN